jgi:hypothetical protein
MRDREGQFWAWLRTVTSSVWQLQCSCRACDVGLCDQPGFCAFGHNWSRRLGCHDGRNGHIFSGGKGSRLIFWNENVGPRQILVRVDMQFVLWQIMLAFSLLAGDITQALRETRHCNKQKKRYHGAAADGGAWPKKLRYSQGQQHVQFGLCLGPYNQV